MAAPLKIRTERLELIAATAVIADAEITDLHALGRLLDVAEPDGDWPPEMARDAVQMFAAMLRRDPELAGWVSWYWVLVEPCTGQRVLIGCGGFTKRPVNGVVAIGYSLLPQYYGKGYATEAVLALVQWAFRHPEVVEIIADVVKDNLQSRRVLEKAGFIAKGPGSDVGTVSYGLMRKENSQ